MNRFLRTGYWALLLGGAVLAAGAALSLTVAGPLSQQALSGRFELGAVLRMLGTTAIIVGVGALAARQADRAGRFGIVAYLLTVASLVLHAGWMFSDAFISGAMATHAPGVLDGTIDDSRIGLAAMAGWIANAMVLLLAVATLRARVFPKVTGWALVAMGGLTLIPLPLDGPAYEVLIGLAGALAGWGATRVAPLPEVAEEPAVLVA
ncbi:MAG: hypothetical protein U0R76_18155 [Candidatus Nanopelagicales bacterium]